MRTGALGRLELITQIPLAAEARGLYGGREGALRQMVVKIETALDSPSSTGPACLCPRRTPTTHECREHCCRRKGPERFLFRPRQVCMVEG
jgi:hypothetical protein